MQIFKYTPLLITILILSGCFGMLVTHPDECPNEEATLAARSVLFHFQKQHNPTKSEYLKEWGIPKEKVPISDGLEKWRYEYHLWCGIIPCFVVCVPLVLPLCDGFAVIEFQGDIATWLRIKREVTSGVLILPPSAGSDKVCRDYEIEHKKDPIK